MVFSKTSFPDFVNLFVSLHDSPAPLEADGYVSVVILSVLCIRVYHRHWFSSYHAWRCQRFCFGVVSS